ncbi:MAG: type III-A CRISPR-associated protein Csm2 [Thiolinea sp.]
MSQYQQQHQGATLETSEIILNADTINPELFNGVAMRTAQALATGKQFMNKSTQIRRFYDELLMWHSKAEANEAKFAEYLPFIRMLNAKVAYAEGRKHVDANFTLFMQHCLGQVDSVETLRRFKLFFEAMLGFYKLEKKD